MSGRRRRSGRRRQATSRSGLPDRHGRRGHGYGAGRRSTARRGSRWRSRNRCPVRRFGPLTSSSGSSSFAGPAAASGCAESPDAFAGGPGSVLGLARRRRPAAHAGDRQPAADQAQAIATNVDHRPRRCRPGRAAPGPGPAHRAAALPARASDRAPRRVPGLTECPMPNGLPTTNTRLPSFGPSAAACIGRRIRGATSSNVKPVCGSAASQRAAWGRPR